MTPRPAAVTRRLSHAFGPHPALRTVDLALGGGACVCVAGPNGAGKTTLLRILAGLTRPTSGELEILGARVGRRVPAPVRARIGYLGHQTLLYGELTGRENLRFFGRLYEVEGLEERIIELSLAMGMLGSLDRPVRSYSRGMQQRLTLIRSVLHRPELVLLDEPDTGLDEHGRYALTRLLSSLRSEGAAVLVASHSPDWGAGLWDEVLLLWSGVLVYRSDRRPLVEGLRRAWRRQVGRPALPDGMSPLGLAREERAR